MGYSDEERDAYNKGLTGQNLSGPYVTGSMQTAHTEGRLRREADERAWEAEQKRQREQREEYLDSLGPKPSPRSASTGDSAGCLALIVVIGGAFVLYLVGYIIYDIYTIFSPPVPVVDQKIVAPSPKPDGQHKRKKPLPPTKKSLHTIPDQPLSVQRKVDEHGKCNRPTAVAIKGGCWVAEGKAPCDDDQYEWKGKCYMPFASPEIEQAANAEH